MSSSELMQKKARRWANDQKNNKQESVGDLPPIEKEIKRFKEEEERYSKAYGAGVFTVEQLKEYCAPLRKKVSSLEVQVAKIRRESFKKSSTELPGENEIEVFAKESGRVLRDLNFKQKRVIVLDVIDKVVGTKERLQVSGYIPVTVNNYVEFKTIGRHCGFTKRGKINPFFSVDQK